HIQQHRRVAEPGERELVVSPPLGIGGVGCGRDAPEIPLADSAEILQIANRNLHSSPKPRHSYDAPKSTTVPAARRESRLGAVEPAVTHPFAVLRRPHSTAARP